MRASAIAVLSAALASAACAQPHPPASQAPAAPAAGQPRAANLQGTDPYQFVNNRHMRAFYALSAETLGKGAKDVDVGAYEQKSYAIFRAFGTEMGMGADAMQDHLKLIPRQVVKIVQEDPHVLDSFENFTVALIGPR